MNPHGIYVQQDIMQHPANALLIKTELHKLRRKRGVESGKGSVSVGGRESICFDKQKNCLAVMYSQGNERELT